MNKHFRDARYYLGRAKEHVVAGLREELEPAGRRFARLRGDEASAGSTRTETARRKLDAAGGRLRRTARDLLADARARVRRYRGRTAE